MSAETAQVLIFKRDRDSGFYCYSEKAEKDDSRRSTSFWDDLAQKWPEGRFSSFFSCDHNA